MTPPMTPREKVEPSLNELLRQAVETMKSWTPEQREAHFEAQKKAWVAAEMAFGDEGTRVITALASGSGDHAELARLAECLAKMRGKHQEIYQPAADGIWSLLAENAALRSRENELIAGHAVAVTALERKLAEAVGLLRNCLPWIRKITDLYGRVSAWLSKEAERG